MRTYQDAQVQPGTVIEKKERKEKSTSANAAGMAIPLSEIDWPSHSKAKSKWRIINNSNLMNSTSFNANQLNKGVNIAIH